MLSLCTWTVLFEQVTQYVDFDKCNVVAHPHRVAAHGFRPFCRLCRVQGGTNTNRGRTCGNAWERGEGAREGRKDRGNFFFVCLSFCVYVFSRVCHFVGFCWIFFLCSVDFLVFSRFLKFCVGFFLFFCVFTGFRIFFIVICNAWMEKLVRATASNSSQPPSCVWSRERVEECVKIRTDASEACSAVQKILESESVRSGRTLFFFFCYLVPFHVLMPVTFLRNDDLQTSHTRVVCAWPGMCCTKDGRLEDAIIVTDIRTTSMVLLPPCVSSGLFYVVCRFCCHARDNIKLVIYPATSRTIPFLICLIALEIGIYSISNFWQRHYNSYVFAKKCHNLSWSCTWFNVRRFIPSAVW